MVDNLVIRDVQYINEYRRRNHLPELTVHPDGRVIRFDFVLALLRERLNIVLSRISQREADLNIPGFYKTEIQLEINEMKAEQMDILDAMRSLIAARNGKVQIKEDGK